MRSHHVVVCLCLLLEPLAAQALNLREVVRYTLDNYPTIVSAQAQRQVAAFDIKVAQAKHYPTVDVAGARRLAGETNNRLGPRVRMNLYASGAIEAEIERETLREQSAAQRETLTREDIAFDVVSAYLRLLAAIQLRETANQNLERHTKLVDDFRQIARIDQGRRFDLVQAKARLEQVRFQLAERDSEIMLAREALARFYPRRFDLAEVRVPATLSEPVQMTPARLAAIADQHPSVQAARYSLRSAQANVRVAKGNRGPRFDVESRAGADSFTQLTLSWPAFDIAAGAAEDAAGAALTGAQAVVDERQRLVGEQQRSAQQAWLSAGQRESIAQGQVAIAKQLVDVYREQFGIGRRNLLDLLNAYAELANAESAVQSSRIDTLLARHQMEYASGRLTLVFVGGNAISN